LWSSDGRQCFSSETATEWRRCAKSTAASRVRIFRAGIFPSYTPTPPQIRPRLRALAHNGLLSMQADGTIAASSSDDPTKPVRRFYPKATAIASDGRFF